MELSGQRTMTADRIVKMTADECDSEAAVCTHIIIIMMVIPDKCENEAAVCKRVTKMQI